MVMPVGQHLPPAVQLPLQQPSRAQVVVKPAQGSGAGVVGMGACVVVVVGVSRIGGRGRLPWVRAAAASATTVLAAAVPPRPSSPLRIERREAPWPTSLASRSNPRSSIAVPLTDYRP
jgi:hypothetical protein